MLRRKRANGKHATGPDFVCVGMQKAGTGWLYDAFRLHPEVFAPPLKELHYFGGKFRRSLASQKLAKLEKNSPQEPTDVAMAEDLEFLRLAAHGGKVNDRLYRRLFTVTSLPVAGELTPAYSLLDAREVARVRRRFPGLKILLLIRNPVDRMWGQLNMQWRRGKVPRKVLEDPTKALKYAHRSYVAGRSYPSAVYERWSDSFGSDRVFVASLDDIIREPHSVLERCYGFLDVDRSPAAISVPTNNKASDRKVPMSDAVREVLVEHFASEVARCQELFGVDWSASR